MTNSLIRLSVGAVLLLSVPAEICLGARKDARLFGSSAIKLKNADGSAQTCELFFGQILNHRAVKAGDSLRFSYGIRPEALIDNKNKVRFSIAVSQKGRPFFTIFTDVLNPEEPASAGWINKEIPLDLFSGKKLSFHFSSVLVTEEGDFTETDPFFALWGGVRAGNFNRGKNEMNFIFISLDTLRADHLGIDGYSRNTSPAFDEAARKGVYFKQAISASSWTLPAHRSMFSGRFSWSQADFYKDVPRPIESVPVDKRTLSEFMYLKGYVTESFTAAGYVAANWGFFRGFERYREHRRHKGKDAEYIFPAAMKWLESNGTKKFFLFLHTYEIHSPYKRKHFMGEVADGSPLEKTIARYDSGILFTDKYVGKLFAKLDELQLSGNTYVIITSDHGEEFREHGKMGHGQNLYEASIRVPLLFYCPSKFKPRIISESQVQSTDLMPTILDLAGILVPKFAEGKSLKPLLLGKPSPDESIAFSEVTPLRSTRNSLSLRYMKGDAKLKMIFSFDKKKRSRKKIPLTARVEFFDLQKDSEELRPVSRDSHPVFSDLEKKFDERFPHLIQKLNENKKEERDVSDLELEEQLRSLGY